MADSGAGEAAQTAEAEGEQPRPKLHHRARGFVKNRPTKQKVGGLAAVVLLVTAPFGGLKAEPQPEPATLHLGKHIDLGPIDVTVQKVVSLPSLSPTIKPSKKGDRLLVIEALVHNRTDEPQVANQLSDAFYGRRVGIPVPGVKTEGTTYLVKDGGLVTGYLNPGLSYQVAVVFEQLGSWRPGTGGERPLLGLNRYDFQTDDPGTLDDDAWLLGKPLVEGPVAIEVKG